MVDHVEYQRWREAAEYAREAADVQMRAGLHSWACFLAEQTVQFAVKGLLHGVGRGVRGHDLIELGGRMEESLALELPPELWAALKRLSRHYIATRYPDTHAAGSPPGHYGSEDALQARADVEEALRFVDTVWSRLSADEGHSDGD